MIDWIWLLTFLMVRHKHRFHLLRSRAGGIAENLAVHLAAKLCSTDETAMGRNFRFEHWKVTLASNNVPCTKSRHETTRSGVVPALAGRGRLA